ncbi:S9 family peptidase [Segetibacter sp. 3557_3]|uniref:S9 family peptidase n=1 Tax=Segetibacter sp. 3557_3 TaxID=2547429 RepID=UPI001058A411|nr:S9 family peptidase [Segetibacter sp. 3557_3]TDH24264.1 S9 family peptidase [Segetibacter sp. 3557_3]
MHKSFAAILFTFSFCITTSFAVLAQQSATLTAADYERAEKMLGYNTGQLVDRSGIKATWLPDDRFWYRVLTPQGSEFILVNPATAKRSTAFDAQKLAGALSSASGAKYDANRLPFSTINYTNDQALQFSVAGKNWKFNAGNNSVVADDAPRTIYSAGVRSNSVLSPDGKRAAFIREHNLWVREVATNKETQLTTDGIKDFGYATDNAGWKKSDRAILAWSPDSKKIATFQQDQRKASDMYLVTTNVGKPTLQAWKYPLPGDKDVITIHRVIIEVDNPKVIRLKMPPDPRRGTLCDDISCGGKDFGDVDWSADASSLAFVSTSRDHKQATVWIANPATGEIRQVFAESVATQFESGQGSINWRYLPATNEILWFSERDNWGHLYLYDATTGQVKNQVTKGEWAISKLLKVDEKTRTLYFLAGGREQGRNPYFSHLYSVGFDGKKLTLLTPEDGNHQVSFSPSGKYFVDSYSKQDVPPVMVLRTAAGKLVLTLEKADISRLTATGWKPPTPIVVKARDNQTDLYGLMFTPTRLDPTKKYPIINYIYPGPQGGSIRSWGFENAVGDNQALAELGFVVVAIEGTCNPLRSKSFHDMCYGNMADNTLPDQIAGMKQLAAKYPYIDIDRAGIWGHSGGGYATAAAMFRFPEFFKVGISESGNHENRNYEDDWGERYIGLLTVGADGKSNYEAQANQNYAKNLKGKLMLAHGMLDDNVPPYNTLLVVEALEKANKDFDLVIFPNSRHGYGEFGPYMMRRRWDYFVRHLLAATPPQEYELKTKPDPRVGG